MSGLLPQESAMTFYTAGTKRGRGTRPPTGGGTAAPSIRIEPITPPTFQSLPATWTPTVYVTGLARVKWAVFHVSTSNQYTSDMVWQEVDVVNGRFVPSAPIQQVRDVLVVKSLDDTIVAESGKATVNQPPPSDTSGVTAARNFISDMTVGLNIERGMLIWSGLITTEYLQYLFDLGVTHLRFVGPWGSQHNSWPNLANGDGNWLLDACERAMAVGHKITVDCLDIMYDNEMQDSRVMPHIREFGRQVRARNWDVTRCAIGAAQEYGGGTNTSHQAKMHEAIKVLREELPNHLLLAASANWGNPWTLIDGTFVPPPDDRVLYQWHIYADAADQVSTTEDIQYWLSQWSAETGLVTWCGEYSTAPADGGNGLVGSGWYYRWPSIIEAGYRGLGQQRPTYWVVTDGSYWRLNKGSGTETAELQDGVRDAIVAGDAHIRAQSWFQPATNTGGGGAPAPAGKQVSRLQIVHRGQSNAYYAQTFGADGALREVVADLTQLPVDLISRLGTSDSTIHSGTYSFWDSPYNNDDRWLDAYGNYGSSPSGWGNRGPMQGTLAAYNSYVSTDQEIPLYDLRLHWEYDLAMEDAASKAAYRGGAWEITQRLRNTRPKAAGKHVALYLHCPYQGGNWHALADIDAAWRADAGDPARNVLIAGNMMDGQPNTQYDPNGDYSHWGDQSAPRIYPRIGFQVARHAYDQGWLPSGVDLSDCPSVGPRISAVTRSGNSLNATVTHDRGSQLVAGADGVDWTCFTASDANGNGHLEATGGAITGNNTFRVDFPSQPTTGGRLWYCRFPAFRWRGLIRDNWHSSRPAKYGNVRHVGVVEFPLQRTLQGVGY